MRTRFLIAIIAIILLGSCKKAVVINFNCKVAGTYLNSNTPTFINGNATAAYYPDINPPYMQITMVGANNQSVAIAWYYIDSTGSIPTQISAKTYSIPTYYVQPLSVEGVYNAPNAQANYLNGHGTGGSVIVTSNTGTTISGTFSFSALNQSPPYDTVYITAGSFTNVPIP